jgi:regulator of RNase E activity RraA
MSAVTAESPVRLRADWDRPAAALVAAVSRVPASVVGDVLGRLTVMDGGIRRIAGEGIVAGPAVTVLTRAGDNLAIFHALDLARAGDVLVVAGRADESRALLGDLIGELLVARGIAGVIVDGAVRDVDALAELGLSVFARGVSPAGPFKNGPGVVGCPVACGGVVVQPGDLVVGDGDGVAVVAQDSLDACLEAAEAKLARESDLRRRIRDGADVVDELLNIGVQTGPTKEQA